ncbi:hypothetical protein B0T24DRAFT_692904 [Lasiosphaeria ovina]|uniref:Myb/SANT-like domain-containing protein n=1 Tax=Lasiosphaeria ovina TaxID=92902 RepID=A0AAE0JS86_9PEZI|nr:hypothetical protein B0T24DRAFT_692904 [Lasiosphaeria ovina]
MSQSTAEMKAQMAISNLINDPEPGPHTLPLPGMRQDGLPSAWPSWPAPAAGGHRHALPPAAGGWALPGKVVSGAPGQPARRPHWTWPDTVKLVMLQSMADCLDLGFRPHVQFQPRAYYITIAAIASRAGLEISFKEVRSLMQTQRKRYRLWQELGAKPETVWDDDLQQWTLTPAEWRELIAENSDMGQFRGRALQWPHLLEKLWGGTYRPLLPIQRHRPARHPRPRQRRKSSSSSSSSSSGSSARGRRTTR